MITQPLDLEALLSIPYVDAYDGFVLSPDGKKVAFSWNKTGQWEIYEIPVDGSNPAKQLTSGPGGKFGPQYSRDGNRLAYVLDLDGGENFDIYVYDFSRGQHTNLTPNTPEAILPNPSWSPDGSQIAFISNREGTFSTYVMPAIGGERRMVFCPPHPNWDVQWSPDGLWLVVIVEGRGQDYNTYLIPAEGGEPRAIGGSERPIHAAEARWAPDSQRIAFASNEQGFYQIGIYDLQSDQINWVTSGKGDKQAPTWSPDGDKLAYKHCRGETTRLVLHNLKSATFVPFQVEEGIHHAPRFTADGRFLVSVFENPRHPPDVWRLSLKDGVFQQLTYALPDGLRKSLFIMPRVVRYAGMDGRPVPALLYRPTPIQKPAPAVVLIHGGPNWHYQIAWMPLVQHMVSRGWVVLAPNYRGSTGYGKAWQLASRFDLGGVDTGDIVTGADFLVRRGMADPNRIAVTGRSHGGYLTMTCLTRYPDRWVAGSAVVPFLNWFTAHENARQDLQHWDIENFGNPEENRALWHDRSPFFFLERIRAPVQLICGANDPRCPASESIQARDSLAALGKKVDFVLYPDEGHTFLKIGNILDSETRRISFLTKMLENTEE